MKRLVTHVLLIAATLGAGCALRREIPSERPTSP